MHRRLLALFCALSASAVAQTSAVPTLMTYQGHITDASGVAVGNTTPVNRVVIFRIWDSPNATTAGHRLYSEQQTVTISGGDFSVLIGAGTAVAADTGNIYSTLSGAVFGGATRYLGVTVDDGDNNLTNDPESSPRQQIVTSAFAFRAQVAESVASGGVASTSFVNSAVTSAAIADTAVTSAKLATSAVGTTQLADAGVTSAKLAASAVGTAALADGAVTSAKLATGALDSTKISDGAVTLAKLATDSVNSAKIVDGAVATADLANSAVDSTKLADGAVTLAKHAASSVGTSALVDGSVTLAKHAANSVDSSKIVDGSVALADLTTGVQDVLSKPRAIYNQTVSPTVDSVGWTLVPIDLGDLGDDADGCRIQIIAAHRQTTGLIGVFDVSFWPMPLQAAAPAINFTNAVSTSSVNNNQRYLTAKWNNSASLTTATLLLPPLTISSEGDKFTLTYSGNDWIRFYNYYPGSLRTGDTDRQNTSNVTTQGPTAGFQLNITSIVTGTNKLTITVDNAHAIQVGDSVTLAGISGSPSALGTKTVTAQPDRTSFEVALTGAAGSYSGGTVTYVPKFNALRIWAAVHPNISARFIVSDR